jgi:sn-glycerol 3-phosphate transport system substrate-binding protein
MQTRTTTSSNSTGTTKRQLFSRLGAIDALPLLAACGAQGTGTEGAPAAGGQKQKITYWGSFSGDLGKAEQEIVAKFNSSRGDVEVDYQFQGSYEDTAQKLTAALQARTAPDMSLLSDVWWFKFYLDKMLMPLDDLMKAEKVQTGDYVDALLKEGVKNGKTYWLPFARSTPLFYYNKELWQKAGLPDRGPRTWDELVKDWAPKLKPHSQTQGGAVVAHPSAASYVAWLFQGVIWQFGGQYSDDQFAIKIQEPKGVQAGEFYRQSVKDGWAYATTNPDPDFNGGAVPAMMASTGGLVARQKAARSPIGTAFLPEGPAGFGCCTGGAGMAILSSTPKEKAQAAMKWIHYATGQAAGPWAIASGYMPVRKSAVNGPEYAAFARENPNVKTAVDQLAKVRPQDAARVFIPNGDQIIGKGIERLLVNGEAAEPVWKDVSETLKREAEPVVRKLRALNG